MMAVWARQEIVIVVASMFRDAYCPDLGLDTAIVLDPNLRYI
jgi:hypothetical protein